LNDLAPVPEFTSPDMARPCMRPAQAAIHLGISRSTLYKYLVLRGVAVKKIGRMTLIPVDNLADLFDQPAQPEAIGGLAGGPTATRKRRRK
jgi:hypothetical protein